MKEPVRFNLDEVFAAMCAWEYILECMRDPQYKGKYEDTADLGGTWAARDWCASQARIIEEAYRLAAERHFDDAYDWEFVPSFMEEAYNDSYQLVPEWKLVACNIARRYTGEE